MSLEHLQAFFNDDNNKGIQIYQEEEQSQDKPILTASIKIDSKNRELHFKMAENIKRSERLRAEITKGIKNNKPIDDLFLIAIECISLMTGDDVWQKQNIKSLEGRA